MSNNDARKREEERQRNSAERARYALQERLKAEERRKLKEKQAEERAALNEQYSSAANVYAENAVYTNETPAQKSLCRPALNNRFGPSFTGPAKTSPGMRPKAEPSENKSSAVDSVQNKPAQPVSNFPKLDRHFKF